MNETFLAAIRNITNDFFDIIRRCLSLLPWGKHFELIASWCVKQEPVVSEILRGLSLCNVGNT